MELLRACAGRGARDGEAWLRFDSIRASAPLNRPGRGAASSAFLYSISSDLIRWGHQQSKKEDMEGRAKHGPEILVHTHISLSLCIYVY